MIDHGLLPLLISGLILFIMILYIGLHFVRSKIIFILIPITLGLFAYSFFTVKNILGYPISREFKDESLILYQAIGKDEIFIWVVEPNAKEPLALKFPMNKHNKEQSEGARGALEAGIPQMLKKKGDSPGEFMIYNFVMITGPEKNRSN